MKKLKFIICIAILVAMSCSSPNKDNFVSLFNGEDLTNWSVTREGAFDVIDGELVTRSVGNGYDIYSEKWYGNFIFRFEFLLSEIGNSGVFIRCIPGEMYFTEGVEVQLLAPWTPYRDDLHCTGSLYAHVAVQNRPDETTGIWHKMEIICDRNLVTISINDQVTTHVSVDTVASMAGFPYYGAIGFQGNHSKKKPDQFAKFRNICIRDLDAEPDYVIKGFYEENDRLRKLAIDAAVNLGKQMIDPLAGMLSDEHPGAVDCAKQALFDITAKASAPTALKSEKKKVAKALKNSIKNTSSQIAKDYLIWLSGMIK